MRVHLGSAMIAVVGLSALTGVTFRATQQSSRVAAVLPPWQSDGPARAAATGLAIVDLHWNNRMIVFDIDKDPTALTRLSEQGFWLFDATGTTLCGVPEGV